MGNSLEGKVALVTGGSSGIGFATAKRLIEEGATVFIFGRRQAALDKALVDLGENAFAVSGDVSRLSDLDTLYKHIGERKGALDIVFANAAMIEMQPLGQITEASFDRLFAVNVKGIVFTIQKALPLLRDGGSIILTSSVAAYKGIPGQAIYNSSKATIRALARTWIMELRQREIRVNVVTPGVFDTEGVKSALSEEARQALFAHISAIAPTGRIGRPVELANVVAFLASDAAAYVNGSDFQIDGGFSQI
jgi:NAD(P)-dependent dehydrogenase (short-subunit alcohol dehydrogenase family)